MAHAYLLALGRSAHPPMFCQKKVFASRHDAMRALNNLCSNPSKPLASLSLDQGRPKAYLCPFCREWHVGSPRRKHG